MHRQQEEVGPTRKSRQQTKPASEVKRETVELRGEELEERIAPKLASNHNETFLVDR